MLHHQIVTDEASPEPADMLVQNDVFVDNEQSVVVWESTRVLENLVAWLNVPGKKAENRSLILPGYKFYPTSLLIGKST